ncbi:MAG: GGDEF domain-containing protein [Bacilli bacterium]|nr:GGDEF domain-containing protein [Bacilli bacterium]
MNKKKIALFSSIVALVLISVGLVFYFITREDKITTLNLIEKQWIESNKNNVIDMSIINDIPLLSYNGEGLIVEFLDSLNEQTNLSFNKVSYNINEEVKTEYAFKMVDNIGEKDILIYTDNYVLVTKKDVYTSVDQMNITVGVLNSDLSNVNNYLFGGNIVYKTYSDKNAMLLDLSNDTINAAVLLKTTNLKDIITNDYKVAYDISDYKKYFVLSLGKEEKLNNILTKYYKKWSGENYLEIYNSYLSKSYFKFNEITDSESVKFRSKRYNYGFIENAPYDTVMDAKLSGINNKLLTDFSILTDAEISYKKYNSIEDLVNAFNKNEIDFFYGINKDMEYQIDTYNTSFVYDNEYVILKHTLNDLSIKSIKSLKDVSIIKNSELEDHLTKNSVTYKTFNNLKDLVNNINEKDTIIMDINSYNYYKDSLTKYVICTSFRLEPITFIIRDIEDNKVFSQYFDFYLTFNDSNTYVTYGLNELINVDKTEIVLKYVAVTLGSIVAVLLIVLAVIKIKPKNKKKVNLSKEDKLRYIDSLTSLKNRNYLNDSLEKWDSSEIYPQSIVIVDLNNIAYINDNYGHTEGDFVISEAANILILNQMENTEIIRTNGNEFLIYLVGYDEKQVITYMRKLNKEFKELKHNFGAAMGYSMITDAIKTVDDAINEATLDMRNNKDDITRD